MAQIFRVVAQYSVVKTRRMAYILSEDTTEHRLTKPRDVWHCSCHKGKYVCDAMVALFKYLRQQSEAELTAERAREDEAQRIRETAIATRHDTGPRLYL
jgi:Na+-translocating ferredoxin:NAD+ oxidoreductase RnfC subunit